jgi:hypothetical protein
VLIIFERGECSLHVAAPALHLGAQLTMKKTAALLRELDAPIDGDC